MLYFFRANINLELFVAGYALLNNENAVE